MFYGELNYLPPELEPIAPIIEAGIAVAFPIEGVSEPFQRTEEDAVTGSLTLLPQLLITFKPLGPEVAE